MRGGEKLEKEGKQIAGIRENTREKKSNQNCNGRRRSSKNMIEWK